MDQSETEAPSVHGIASFSCGMPTPMERGHPIHGEGSGNWHRNFCSFTWEECARVCDLGKFPETKFSWMGGLSEYFFLYEYFCILQFSENFHVYVNKKACWKCGPRSARQTPTGGGVPPGDTCGKRGAPVPGTHRASGR